MSAVIVDADVPATTRGLLAGYGDGSGPFRLRSTERGLVLDAPDALAAAPLHVDLLAGRLGWRTARVGHERLVRACAVARPRPGGGSWSVLDGTGGLGEDAWLLAVAGARVTVVERHPVLAALLADALERARDAAPEAVARTTLCVGDTPTELAARAPFDVVYLDPMYPPRRKAALGEGRLRVLAALFAAEGLPVEADGGAGVLLEAALASGAPRVVLKRPRRAPTPGPAPSHTVDGRSTRFDVWVRSGRVWSAD
ncbi:MAG: class I SAM-dependent methyltransferase [Pseudomonadales bacterium]|nr:class I SAM-dependent methyltransferase [Pseudomonadales bacterium]